jgi:hypothetical protein
MIHRKAHRIAKTRLMISAASILVHLDGTECSSARLRLAHRLAVLHQAALAGLFAVVPRATASVLDGTPRAAAKALFDRTASTGAPPVSWQRAPPRCRARLFRAGNRSELPNSTSQSKRDGRR